MEGHMTELAVAVHGILTPAQRAQLAERIDSGHLPPFLEGERGKGRRHRNQP
jgi:hypothetical protein